jgi:hypothetical protein
MKRSRKPGLMALVLTAIFSSLITLVVTLATLLLDPGLLKYPYALTAQVIEHLSAVF